MVVRRVEHHGVVTHHNGVEGSTQLRVVQLSSESLKRKAEQVRDAVVLNRHMLFTLVIVKKHALFHFLEELNVGQQRSGFTRHVQHGNWREMHPALLIVNDQQWVRSKLPVQHTNVTLLTESHRAHRPPQIVANIRRDEHKLVLESNLDRILRHHREPKRIDVAWNARRPVVGALISPIGRKIRLGVQQLGPPDVGSAGSWHQPAQTTIDFYIIRGLDAKVRARTMITLSETTRRRSKGEIRQSHDSPNPVFRCHSERFSGAFKAVLVLEAGHRSLPIQLFKCNTEEIGRSFRIRLLRRSSGSTDDRRRIDRLLRHQQVQLLIRSYLNTARIRAGLLNPITIVRMLSDLPSVLGRLLVRRH